MNSIIFISILICFFTLSLSVFILSEKVKSRVNQNFFFLGTSLTLWIISNVISDLSTSYFAAIFWARLSIVWTSLIPIFLNQFIYYLYFVQYRLYKNTYRLFLVFSLIITNIIIFLNQTPLNIIQVWKYHSQTNFIPGQLYYLLAFYLVATFLFAFINLVRAMRGALSHEKSQIRLILVGSLVPICIAIILDIFLPLLGYSSFAIFTPYTVLIFISCVFIAITRHKLFNTKVIITQLVMIALCASTFSRAILAENFGEILNGSIVFSITLILGILLIRLNNQIMRQREENFLLISRLKKSS